MAITILFRVQGQSGDSVSRLILGIAGATELLIGVITY